jgi:subfamily B ATP-binding cassette protein MsbA
VISELTLFVLLCAIIAQMNTLLFLLMAISIPSIIIINILAGRAYRPIFAENETIRDRQVNTINATTEGFVQILSFGVAPRIKSLFNGTLDRAVDLRFRFWRLSAWKDNTEWLFTNGIGAMALWTAWYFSLQGRLTIGAAVATIMYFGMVLRPVVSLAGVIRSLVSASVSATRLLDPVEFSTNHTDASDGITVESNGEKSVVAQLENVSFSYPGSNHMVLGGVDMTIFAGTLTGLFGPSGSGKTTLGKLISGHFKPTRGKVLHFASDMPSSTSCVPNGTLYVSEDVFLLPGSVKENIEFFAGKEDSEALQRCIEKACMHAFLRELPEGVETHLGGSNMAFSGGQKQRLLLARAFYADASRMIVFDESTNCLDPENEQAILAVLRKMASLENKAMLLISHRPSIIESCDVIYRVTSEGKIIRENGGRPDVHD